VRSGGVRPQSLITRRIGLDEVPAALAALGAGGSPASGVTMIRP
jgi:hypothetical protein